MQFDRKNKVGPTGKSSFDRIEKMPPFLIMLYLSLAGLGVLFIILVVAFLQTNAQQQVQIHFPRFFSISSLLLLGSSFTINRVARYYKKENVKKLSNFLFFTLILGLGFVACQGLGWLEIQRSGTTLTGLASGTYLYLITGLHGLHLLGGFIFIIYLMIKTQRAKNDSIQALVFHRNPFVRQQLKMLGIYWHFMDGLWLFLFLVFLFAA